MEKHMTKTITVEAVSPAPITAEKTLTAEESAAARLISHPWIDSDAKFFHYMALKVQVITLGGNLRTHSDGCPKFEDAAATVCYRRERVSDTEDLITLGWAFCGTSDRKAYNRSTGRSIAWDRMHTTPMTLTIPSDESPPTAALRELNSAIHKQARAYRLSKEGFTRPHVAAIEGLPPRWYEVDTLAQNKMFFQKRRVANVD